MSQRIAKSTSRSNGIPEDRPGRAAAFNHWLIRHAADRAPESLAPRLEEEWLADLEARSGALSRLRFSIGCCWATRVIAQQFEPLCAAVAGPLVAAKLVGAYPTHDSGYFPRRSGALFLVVTLHAVLFYGIVTTLSHVHVGALPDPLQNLPLASPHPHELPPPLPPPQWQSTKIVTQMPDFLIAREPDPREDVTTDVSQHYPPPPTPPLPPRAVTQVQGGPGAGFPDPDDFYPPLARHMDEQGATTVRVCVDVNGRLTGEPTTLQGSGSQRLDEGALKLAKAGSGHYRASTEDGRPVNSCYPFRIRFQLKN